MSKNRKRTSNSLIYFAVESIAYLIILIFKILSFFIAWIGFYNSKYGQKSGNSYLKTMFDKGAYGEYQLYRQIIKVIDKDNVLTNVYLPTDKIDDTEVDIVAISDHTIYCFEMKNYSGMIFGDEYNKIWTQTMNKYSKYKFLNPIIQNKGHVKALREYLGTDNITPVIVFANNAKKGNLSVGANTVIKVNSVKKYIRYTENNCSNSIESIKKDEYINELTKHTLVSDDIKEKHINQINECYNQK